LQFENSESTDNDIDKSPLDIRNPSSSSTFPSTSKSFESENLKRPSEPETSHSERCKKTKHDLAQVSFL
jgi:hypothetical protein